MRVIVDTVADAITWLGYVHDLYKPIPGRFKDYISTPKPNGYQSLHTTVIGRAGIPFEIQIRTTEMHKMAEYGVAAHWKYKQGLDKKAGEETFAWIRQLLEAQQDTEAEDFIKNIKVDLFADEVFVFTPKGDVVNMPAGRDPHRPRLRHPFGGRQPHDRLQDKRPHRAHRQPAQKRRHR